MTQRRRLFPAALAALAAAMLFAAVPAWAETGQPYVVTVHVDVEAQTASAAREAAMARGQQQALRDLLERLTLPADHSRLPQLDQSRVADLVRSVQLADERTSNVRYIADMTVRFQPDGVRRLLDRAGVNYVDTPSKPVVVLPVWQGEGRPVLWDDPNPWRDTWERALPPGGLIPVIVPIGGLEDLQAIDAGQALAGDAEALAAIGARYGAGAVLVAAADPQAGTVSLTRFDVATREASPAGSQSLPGPGSDQGMAPAVHAIVEDLESRWKQANMVATGVSRQLAVRVPLTSFDSWVAVRDRLERINMIKTIEVQSLSRSQGRLRLDYVGDVERLKLAMRQHDLVLSPDDYGASAGGGPGQTWMLQLAPSVRPGSSSPGTQPGGGQSPGGPQPGGQPSTPGAPYGGGTAPDAPPPGQQNQG